MSAAENTTLARRAIEKSFDGRSRAVVDELYAPAFDRHASAAPGRRNPEGTQEFATMLRAALFHQSATHG